MDMNSVFILMREIVNLKLRSLKKIYSENLFFVRNCFLPIKNEGAHLSRRKIFRR